jgi:C-terminal processing protease CtpA/Prc
MSRILSWRFLDHEASESGHTMKRLSILGLCLLLVAGCNPANERVATQTITPATGIAVAWTPTPRPTSTASPTLTETPTPTATASPTPAETPAPSPSATETPTPTPTVESRSDEQVLANLVAFARLYGYVRYFHPSDEAAGLNWERVAINGVAAIQDATEPADLAQKLQAFFQPCAPTLRVFPLVERPEVPAELYLPGHVAEPRVVMWQHCGVEGELPGSIYHSDRISAPVAGAEIPDGFHDPREPFYAELGGDVAALVPLALFADDAGTLPRVSVSTQDLPDQGVAPGTSNRRLAGVVIAWNVFQHFYPYFDVVDTDWPQVLESALTGTLDAADETAYHHVLRRLLAQLHDGHAFTLVDRSADVYSPHVRLSWVEDSLVVLEASGKAAYSVAAGDVILTIDGQPAAQVLANIEELTSGATPQWKHERALRDLLAGPPGSRVQLVLQTDSDEPRPVSLQREVMYWSISPQGPRPAQVTELEPGIMYVDLTRVEDEDFETAFSQLEAARGIIFDLRGYPQVSIDTIGHLIDVPVASPQMYVPLVTHPDQQNVAFDFLSWDLEPKAPRFKARIAFLADGQALSYAETYLGIIEHYQLAEIVGEPTGGTNGNRAQFSLPGGYTCSWTGMKVLKHDGSQHHGVGIQPTIFVSRTIQGIREGRDEQLERALAAVK